LDDLYEPNVEPNEERNEEVDIKSRVKPELIEEPIESRPASTTQAKSRFYSCKLPSRIRST
jgi:hypothetical protein